MPFPTFLLYKCVSCESCKPEVYQVFAPDQARDLECNILQPMLIAQGQSEPDTFTFAPYFFETP